jgi:hypothetical protein
MASFAKIDSNGKVIQVVSVANQVLYDSNGVEQEEIGIQFLKNLFNEQDAIWKQTSYNTMNGIHNLGGTPFRKNYAGIGYTYDSQRDAFIPEKPYNSWILNENTCNWDAPVAYPTDGNMYNWNEENQNWVLQNI